MDFIMTDIVETRPKSKSSTTIEKEIENKVRFLAKEGLIGWTKHAKERMIERGISTLQVISCLMKGKITEGPVYTHEKGGGYRITFDKICAGHSVRVVSVLSSIEKLLIVTVIKYEK
jgi:hypothetical protein